MNRVARVLVTALAGLVVMFVANSYLGSGSDSQQVATASLLPLPLAASDQTPIATTAPVVTETEPLQVPTATPEPTPQPTSTPVPSATATPLPEPTLAPTSPPVAAPAPAADAAASPTEENDENDENDVQVPDEDAPNPQLPADDAPNPQLAAPTATSPAAAPVTTATAEPTSIAAEAVEATPTATVEPTPVPTATAEPLSSIADLENYVLGAINDVRAKAGLGPVALHSSVSIISREWSQQMATGGFFSHRPADQLNTMLPAGWRQWGENIASAPDIFWAQSSLEDSPGHYANMVGSFTHVGIGVYQANGKVWVTQNFVRY